MSRRLFGLDQNFPEPVLGALAASIVEAELVPLRTIDKRLPLFKEDWRILLALKHHERAWDGMITTDTSMLDLPRELAVLMQTKLTLVAATKSGHDPLRATGLLLTHLPFICRNLRDTAQVWVLRATQKAHDDPWSFFTKLAERRSLEASILYESEKLSEAELHSDPLSHDVDPR
jgi:hypothetical protein